MPEAFRAAGYVETVVLLGTPVSLRPERWAMARSVVSGRFINGFSRRDWVLGLVYRGTNGFIKARLSPEPLLLICNSPSFAYSPMRMCMG